MCIFYIQSQRYHNPQSIPMSHTGISLADPVETSPMLTSPQEMLLKQALQKVEGDQSLHQCLRAMKTERKKERNFSHFLASSNYKTPITTE